MIEFLCPNGHRVHCGDEQAGRAAKCPQCGVKFRVPELADIRAAEAAASQQETPDNPPPQPAKTSVSEPQVAAVPEPQVAAAVNPPVPTPVPQAVPAPSDDPSEQQIEFLCPNGHRLHGPASSQGQPGECPECGQKFYIPAVSEVSEEVDAPQDPSAAQPPEDETVAEETSTTTSTTRSPAKTEHPLCELMSKLWAQRPSRATVEVHLSNGETFIPDRFAEGLSQQQYSLFAIKEPGGTHTLTLVSWDSIVRIEVRGAESLPKEMQ